MSCIIFNFSFVLQISLIVLQFMNIFEFRNDNMQT